MGIPRHWLILSGVLILALVSVRTVRGRAPDGRDVGASNPVLARDARPAAPPYAPGHLILKLSGETAAKAAAASAHAGGATAAVGHPPLDALNRRHGAREMRALFGARARSAARLAARFPRRTARALRGSVAPVLDGIYVLELSTSLDMEQVAREYATIPGVVYAEPDRIAEATFLPNDPFFSSSGSWGQPYRDLWGLVQIDGPAAWDVTRGAGVIIAISDTGVDHTHPDIAARIWTNPGEIPGNGIDDDGNGFIDDTRGRDFVNNDNDPFDDNGHGTHVAGTAAGIGNNGLGITGVAWEATVMPVKGLSASGSGLSSELAQTIVYATDNGADVINASWGGLGTSQLVSDAIAAAHAAGVVFVAAAGNASQDVGDFFPASDPNAITVSAFNHDDTLAYFSNFGSKIDVAAPGGGDLDPNATAFSPQNSILSLRSAGAVFSSNLTVGGSYLRLQGTSMAAPHVAGAAALILAVHPGFNVEQVRQALRGSADDVDPPGLDPGSGYGRINVGRAVSGAFVDVPVVEITNPRPGTRIAGVVSVTGTASGPGFASYVLEYGAGAFPTTWLPIAGPITTPVESGALGTWDVTLVPDGSYVLRARAFTTTGGVFESRVSVVIDSVELSAPATDSILGAGGAPVEIRGSAAGAGFERYAIEYRAIAPDLTVGPWTTAGITLPAGDTTPVHDGLLATLDPNALPGGRDVDLRLTVTTGAGTFVDEVHHVVVDTTLRPGWPRRIPTSRVTTIPMRNQVTLADLDGDGAKEILTAWNDLVYVLRGDGSDFPGWPQSVTGGVLGIYYADQAPTAADLDGDGRLEVVATTSSFARGGDERAGESIFVWHDDGTPMAGWPRSGFVVRPAGARGSRIPKSDVVLSDVDGDGTPDLVAHFRERLVALRADGTSLSGFPLTLRCGAGDACFEGSVAVGDTDGDGRKDLAFIETVSPDEDAPDQYLFVTDNTGAVRTGWPRKITRHRYPENSPILADFDGDGQLDVTANTDKAKQIRIYNGAAHKIVLRPHIPEFRFLGFRSRQDPPSAGDIDGDGKAELFVATDFPDTPLLLHGALLAFPKPYSGTDWLNLLGGGGGRSGWPIAFHFSAAEKTHGPGTASIGDIDGDGLQEIVTGSGTCAFWGYPDDETLRRCYTIYAFRPDGSLLPGFPKPTPAAGATKTITPALGDLDGDGLNEIVWVDAIGDVLVWNVPGTPGPEHMQWPMFRHDPGHTGALVANP